MALQQLLTPHEHVAHDGHVVNIHSMSHSTTTRPLVVSIRHDMEGVAHGHNHRVIRIDDCAEGVASLEQIEHIQCVRYALRKLLVVMTSSFIHCLPKHFNSRKEYQIELL